MRHRLKIKKLGRKTTARMAMLYSQTAALFKYGKIKMTLDRAKAVKKIAERLIGIAKYNTLASRRRIAACFGNSRDMVKKTMELGARFEGRAGGFTRIIKLADRRKGDGAFMVILELV